MKLSEVKNALEIIGIVGGLFVGSGAVVVWWKRTTNATKVEEKKAEILKLNEKIEDFRDERHSFESKILLLEKANSEMVAILDMTSKLVKDDADIARKLYEYVVKNSDHKP